MTEIELIDRLQHELTTSPAWRDIQAVISRQGDARLGSNELLIVPVPNAASLQSATMLRIVVEPLIVPG